MSKEIELFIRSERWEDARELILKQLKSDSTNHWLITRLSLTYYEQYDYETALDYSKIARKIAPKCPLVLWDYAGTLEMLSRNSLALGTYRKLIDRGVESIAFDECGEGLGWARGLIADSHYRAAHCCRKIGRINEAKKHFKSHLALRGPGCRSIYNLKKVRAEFSNLA
jgi:tetratricopeptide (TPR) repeat protein